jgi:hypothetical protein
MDVFLKFLFDRQGLEDNRAIPRRELPPFEAFEFGHFLGAIPRTSGSRRGRPQEDFHP